MPDTVPLAGEAVLEVVSPDGARRFARISQTPFMIGRGAETGNHLQLSDRRISRNCAAIVIEANRFYVEDRGQRRGLFVNGEKVDSRELQDGDSITFGLDDSYEIIFRSGKSSDEDSLPHLLTRMEHITSSEPTGGGLVKLKRLLEATSLLHGREKAEAAAETARRTFEEGALAQSLPTVEVKRGELKSGVGVLTAYVNAGLVASTSEARRQIKGGGVRVNDKAVTDEKLMLTLGDLTPEGVIKLSLGKKKHILLKPV